MIDSIYPNNYGVFNDPIYGHIYYSKPIEEPIINDLVLQRLRYIRQLQFSYLVYPGADHTRFQHSIGVMHLAGLLCKNILYKLGEKGFSEICRSDDNYGKYRSQEVLIAIRLAGLLHDIGHGPYGHAFDEYVLNKYDLNHEDITYIIYQNRVRRLIQQNLKGVKNINSVNLLNLLDLFLTDSIEKLDKCSRFFRSVIKDWFMPADILDFLLRDSFYTGTLEYGWINYERLVNAVDIVDFNGYPVLALNWKSRDEFRKYVLARQLMYERVYLHPGVRAFEYYFARLASDSEILDRIGVTVAIEKLVKHNCIEDYLYINESSLFSKLLDLYKNLSQINDLRRESKEIIKEFVEAIYLKRKSKWKLVKELRKVVYNAKDLYDTHIDGAKNELKNIALAIKDNLINNGLVGKEDIFIDGIKEPLLISILPSTSFRLLRGMGNPFIPINIRINGESISRYLYIREFMREFGVFPIVIVRIYIDRRKYIPEIVKRIHSSGLGEDEENKGIGKWFHTTH